MGDAIFYPYFTNRACDCDIERLRYPVMIRKVELMASGERPIREIERMLVGCNGGTLGQQGRVTDMLVAGRLIRVGKKGGTHQTFRQGLREHAHFLLAETAPRKSAIADHVIRYADIKPTHPHELKTDDELIERVMNELAFHPGNKKYQNGIIRGADLTLRESIERIIDVLADNPELGEWMEQVSFALEVLETPPVYMPQANFVMERGGRRVDWHYSGAPQLVAHDKTEIPTRGPLIRTVRLGAAYFRGSAEIWADTKAMEARLTAA
jgi:hypothetical protein